MIGKGAYTVTVNNAQELLPVDGRRIRAAVTRILSEARIARAEVGVTLVDDDAIRDLNRRYLKHDRPTDVIAFPLERAAEHLEGEIVVSAETARSRAGEYGWRAEDELLLYVVHGTLHLTGYDDRTAEARARMQERERDCLAHFGLTARYDADEAPPAPSAPPSRGGTKGK